MSLKKADILIVGAGIAGLSAGCYAQMNGYRTKILEMHNLPGGLCTAWQRKGYLFEGCLHYLFGSGPGQPFHRMWEELGIAQNLRFVDHEEMMRITGPEGEKLVVYADPDRLERHMKDISPGDSRLIESFCAGIRTFTRFDMTVLQQKPKDLMNLMDWARLGMKMMPYASAMAKWATVSAQEFGQRFKDPFLRRAIPQMFAWPTIPVFVGMFLLAYMYNRNAGVPLGSSLGFARTLEKRYVDLGGEVCYRSQVERILTDGKRETGVRLYDNQVHYAHRVISACDGRSTFFDLLGKEFTTPQIRKLYDGHLPIHSQLQVSLGVDRDFSTEPHWITCLLDDPILVAGEKRYEIGIKHYGFDPSLAPPGKSVVIAMLTTPYNYWQRIYGRSIYDIEQIQESRALIDLLDQIYPGIKKDIEIADVATPLSYERYTGNWQGSSCGWLLTRQTMGMMIRGMRKTLPALQGFYLIGQWVEPGGSVPVVAMSGQNIIQQICHEDGKPFATSIPKE